MPSLPWDEPAPRVDELDGLLATPNGSVRAAYWASLQFLHHVFAAVTRSDPRTGAALHRSLVETLTDLSRILRGNGYRPFPVDGLVQAIRHGRRALERILDRPRERMLRQHVVVSAAKVREMDARCVAWLARQPGRNLREKLGERQQAMTIVRPFTADIHENRLVRRVLDELSSLLARRLGSRGAYELALPGGGELLDELETAFRLCREATSSSAFADIPAAAAPQPNNVLLSDRDYGVVWRVWKWLRQAQSDLDRAWPEGERRFRDTILWCLMARIWDRFPTVLFDMPCAVGPGRGEESFGIRLQEGPASEETVRVLVDAGHFVAVLSASVKGASLLLECIELTGRGVLRGRPVQVYVVSLAFESSRTFQADRYLPFSASIHSGGRLIERYARRDAYADLWGVRRLCDWVIGIVIPSRTASQPSPTTETRPAEAFQVGLDPSSVRPRVTTEHGRQRVSLRMLGIRLELPSGQGEWVAGSDTRRVNPWIREENLVALPDAFGEKPPAAGSLELAVHAAMDALVRELRPHPLAELAVAVPDQTDEMAHRPLRAAIGPAFGKLWFIPRSVAAAAGWQTLPSFGSARVEDEDILVVLDAEAPALTATCLIARRDDSNRGDTAPVIYWERHPAPPPLPQSECLTYRAFLEGILRGILAWQAPPLPEESCDALIARLIRSGDAEALVEDGRTIWVPLPGERGETWLRLDRPDATAFDDVVGRWLDGLRAWLRDWGRSPGFARIKDALRQRRCHILPVGRPFQDPTFKDQLKHMLRDDPLFRDVRSYCHTEADVLVAEGAVEFLRRQHAGVPTWEDWLPALHLEVVGESGFLEYIPVFEERRVRPGEEILFRTDEDRYPLTLPPGRPSYYFPLVRNLDSRTPLAYDARLRHPSFPLREPVPVRLEVAYAYGADCYRLAMYPRAAGAPFRSIPVEWTRGEEGGEADEATVPNLAPEFPSEPWSAVPANALQDFVKMTKGIHDRADWLFSPDDPESVDPAWLAEAISRFVDKHLRWAYDSSRALWTRGRTRAGAPGEVLQALDGILLPWLCWFAGLPSEYASPVLERCRGTEVDEAMQKLQLQAWWVLTRFNADAPEDLVASLVPELDSEDTESRDRAFRWLGKILGDGSGPRRVGLEAILHELEAARGRELRAPALALATALWVHPGLVHSVAGLGTLEMVLGILDDGFVRLVRLLEAEGGDRRVGGLRGQFRSQCEALLGLLRLRNTPLAECLAAGSRGMRVIARDIRILDGILVKAGMACDCRFQFSLPSSRSQGQLSDLAYVLVSYLTGEEGVSNIHIEAVSDEEQ